MLKIAPEGWPFIIFFTGLGLIVYAIGGRWTVALPIVLLLFMFYFFRDPERTPPQGEGFFVSPADGRIIVIKDVFEKEYLNKDVKMISIFMSPMNVHVNRAPCDSTVKLIKHTPGGKAKAYLDEASLRNENIAMVIECTDKGEAQGKQGFEILLRQIAGSVARRAVNRKKVGDTLKRGERFGIIKFSSRVDMYLPIDTEIKVKMDDTVRAGETVIGVRGE